MGRSTPVYGARAEKPLQNADFAMKQTNIMSPSGDITTTAAAAAATATTRWVLWDQFLIQN